MMKRIRDITLASTISLGTAWAAQACQPQYTVQPSDTLFSIAQDNLGDMMKWSLILNANPSLMGSSLVDVTSHWLTSMTGR